MIPVCQRYIGRRLSNLFFIVIAYLLLSCCSTSNTDLAGQCKGNSEKYGQLASAVRYLAKAKIAIYGPNDLPIDLTADKFIELAKERNILPSAHYKVLRSYKSILLINENYNIFNVYDK